MLSTQINKHEKQSVKNEKKQKWKNMKKHEKIKNKK